LSRFLFLAFTFITNLALAETKLELLSSYTWEEDNLEHGGYSGRLHLGVDGKSLIAVSDRGDYVSGEIVRLGKEIIDVTRESMGFLKPAPWSTNATPEGRPPPFNSNAEALAVSSDGIVWVAFEGFHRLRRFEALDAAAGGVKGHDDFPSFQSNSGMEALAVDAKGRLYTLPERSGKWTRPFQVYRREGKTWMRWAKLPRRDRFLPTGADIGPDGRFYLLERRFEVLQGFAMRIRRFDLDETGLSNEVTLLESPFRIYGNTEGISVWRAQDGSLRVTVITDDNFSFLQSTQLHEFRVMDERE